MVKQHQCSIYHPLGVIRLTLFQLAIIASLDSNSMLNNFIKYSLLNNFTGSTTSMANLSSASCNKTYSLSAFKLYLSWIQTGRKALTRIPNQTNLYSLQWDYRDAQYAKQFHHVQLTKQLLWFNINAQFLTHLVQ